MIKERRFCGSEVFTAQILFFFCYFLRMLQIYHNFLYMHVCEKESALTEYYILLFLVIA